MSSPHHLTSKLLEDPFPQVFPYISIHFSPQRVNPNSRLAHQILLGVWPLASACGLEPVYLQSLAHVLKTQKNTGKIHGWSLVYTVHNVCIYIYIYTHIHCPSLSYELNTNKSDGRKIPRHLGQLMLQPVSSICYLDALPRQPLATQRQPLKQPS